MHVYLCYAYVTLASARYHDNVDSIRLRYWMYIDYCDCTVKLYYCIFLFFTHTLRVCIFVSDRLRYDTIRYDSVYLTCSKKLTGSQLSPPHGTNKQKLKCETKNKMMSMIGPVRSRPIVMKANKIKGRQKKSKVGRICWKGRFWAWSERVKEWWMMRVVMIIEMSWQGYGKILVVSSV